MVKFFRDSSGSVLIQYTLVFPLFISTLLGTVDVTYMLYEWSLANKATAVGARSAIVSNPVAVAITNPPFSQSQIQQLGELCTNSLSGQRNITTDGQFYCPSMSTVCNATASGGACSNGFRWDEAAFATIFNSMQSIFPRLTRQNLQVSYQTNGLGFVGQPAGLPMNVTVSIECMTHQFHFIDALMNWIFSPPSGCSSALQGPAIPSFASTLQSEDMATN